nr:MAG TPA_asm: hypothetical protein [Bacteriophage sp.]DAT39562.1 MAG TPA: hypothetical protein [Caudoviricetes sp.]
MVISINVYSFNTSFFKTSLHLSLSVSAAK